MKTKYSILTIVFLVGLVAFGEQTSREPEALASFTPPPGYQCRPIDQHPKPRVRRKRKPRPKPAPVVVTKEVVREVPVDRVVEVDALKYRDSLSLLVGMGPYMGGTLDRLPFKVSLGIDYLPVAGIGYARRLSQRWSVGAQGFTNLMWNINGTYHFNLF